jgi:hypothetical protein
MNPRIRKMATVAGAAAMLLVVAGNVAAASPAKLTAVVATDSTGAPPSGQAWIRVLHGSPDAPAVDVYLDGGATPAITALAFGKITDYTPVPAGDHAVKVCATGSITVCPIDVPKLTVADGKKYTIAATNVLAKIQTQVIEDAPTVDAAGAQVRVVHFSANTPAVDVYVNGAKAVTALAYPNATEYLPLPGADYAVKVCATGSTTVCPINVPKLTVADGTAYSVFAVGYLQAAAPSVTPPPTDTVGSTPGSTSSLWLTLAALVAISVASLGLTLRFVTRRAER